MCNKLIPLLDWYHISFLNSWIIVEDQHIIVLISIDYRLFSHLSETTLYFRCQVFHLQIVGAKFVLLASLICYLFTSRTMNSSLHLNFLIPLYYVKNLIVFVLNHISYLISIWDYLLSSQSISLDLMLVLLLYGPFL